MSEQESAPKHRSITEIIKAAGGAPRIAEASDGRVKADAVYKWPKIGIPDRHWPLIMPRANATPDEMHAANVAAGSGIAA